MGKVTFELDKIEYQLPDFLSIDNYVKVYKVKDFLGEEFFQAKLLNAITGAKMESILKASHAEITYLSNYLITLFPNTDYPFYDKFTLNGIDYGFIPSWKNMSFAEFVDLDTLMNKPMNEIIENLHIICAIMYRPITKKNSEHDFLVEEYDSEEMIQRAELFKRELDVKYVLGGQFFFSRFANQSLENTPLYSMSKWKIFWLKIKVTWKMRKWIWKSLLNRHLDGSQLSIVLLEMMLQDIQKSSKLPFWKRLTNYFTS
jgi:hypothetical protein